MLKMKKSKCNGCHACMSVCPKNCISMMPDDEGFLYPEINGELCSECGLCEKTCPTFLKSKYEAEMPKAYAAFNKDTVIQRQSSSGGIFSILADYVLSKKGVVFGVAFNESFEVVHKAIEKKEELGALRVSKYVQSRIGDSFVLAKKFLEEGRYVLFTGTPCQIGGLLSFLNKPYDRLITQDIICHGVPSPAIWAKYVKYREEQAGSPVKEIIFRRKINNWQKYSFSFTFKNGTDYIKTPYYKDPMMRMFLFNRCLRPSCHDCLFKTYARKSDITLADFWGVKKVMPKMYHEQGTSLIIIQSKKGEELFDSVKEKMEFCEIELKKSTTLKKNQLMYRCAYKPLRRIGLMKNFNKLPFEKVVKRYGRLL